jgi:hypothetical protein
MHAVSLPRLFVLSHPPRLSGARAAWRALAFTSVLESSADQDSLHRSMPF